MNWEPIETVPIDEEVVCVRRGATANHGGPCEWGGTVRSEQEAKSLKRCFTHWCLSPAAAESLRREGEVLGENQWRDDIGTVYTFSRPTLTGGDIAFNGRAVETWTFARIADESSDRFAAAFLAWHSRAYTLLPDECREPGKPPRKLEEDEVQGVNGEPLKLRLSTLDHSALAQLADGTVASLLCKDHNRWPDSPFRSPAQYARGLAFWSKNAPASLCIDGNGTREMRKDEVRDAVTGEAHRLVWSDKFGLGVLDGADMPWSLRRCADGYETSHLRPPVRVLGEGQRLRVEAFLAAAKDVQKTEAGRASEQSSEPPAAVLTEAHSVSPSGESQQEADDIEKPQAILAWFGDEAHDGPGFYYYDENYPDEGTVGAFKRIEDARAHAESGDYRTDNPSWTEAHSVSPQGGVSPEFAEVRAKVREAYAKVQSGAMRRPACRDYELNEAEHASLDKMTRGIREYAEELARALVCNGTGRTKEESDGESTSDTRAGERRKDTLRNSDSTAGPVATASGSSRGNADLQALPEEARKPEGVPATATVWAEVVDGLGRKVGAWFSERAFHGEDGGPYVIMCVPDELPQHWAPHLDHLWPGHALRTPSDASAAAQCRQLYERGMADLKSREIAAERKQVDLGELREAWGKRRSYLQAVPFGCRDLSTSNENDRVVFAAVEKLLSEGGAA